MNTNSKINRHPLTFFENMHLVIVAKDPSFFKNELPEDTSILYDHFDLKEEYKDIDYKKLSAGNKIKVREAFVAHREWVSFLKPIFKYNIEQLSNAIFNLSTDKSQKQVKEMNDTIYLSNHQFKLDKDGQIDESQFAIHTNDTKLDVAAIIESMWDFNDSGKKVFQIEEGLMHELLLTEISKIHVAFLELPFQTICLSLPYNTNLRIRKKVIKSVYVSQFTEDDGTKIIKCLSLSDSFLYSLDEFSFTQGDILTQLKEQIKKSYHKSPLAMTEMTQFYTFLLSFLLYLNSESADIIIKTPKVIQPKIDSRLPVCSVGSTITITKAFKAIYQQGDIEDKAKREFNILKWTVRGHFRNQAHGEGLTLRKTLWIRPYIKGRERTDNHILTSSANYAVK